MFRVSPARAVVCREFGARIGAAITAAAEQNKRVVEKTQISSAAEYAVVPRPLAHLNGEAWVLAGSKVALHDLYREPFPRPGGAQGPQRIWLRLLS